MGLIMKHFLFLFFTSTCFASFDSNFEYRSVSQDLPNLSQRRTKIDSEYYADDFTFSFRDSYEIQWILQKKLFLYNAGSLSGKEFLLDRRIKIEADLNPSLGFKLLHFEQSDYENDQNHTIFEFPYRHDQFELSAYFDFSYAKKCNDFGAAITWKPSASHKIRMFHTWGDMERNHRNEATDRFINLPVGYGIKGEIIPTENQKSFVQYGLLIEPQFLWLFPDKSQTFSWHRNMATIYYVNENYSIRTQWDQSYETTQSTPTGTQVSQLYTQKLQLQFGREFQTELLGATPVFGLRLSTRKWQDGANEVKHNAILPHLNLRWASSGRPNSHQWSLEYGNTYFESKGTWSDPKRNETKSENRLNLYWDWVFSNNAIFTFVFAFDLDVFGTEETWEGGNGQFVLLF